MTRGRALAHLVDATSRQRLGARSPRYCIYVDVLSNCRLVIPLPSQQLIGPHLYPRTHTPGGFTAYAGAGTRVCAIPRHSCGIQQGRREDPLYEFTRRRAQANLGASPSFLKFGVFIQVWSIYRKMDKFSIYPNLSNLTLSRNSTGNGHDMVTRDNERARARLKNNVPNRACDCGSTSEAILARFSKNYRKLEEFR